MNTRAYLRLYLALIGALLSSPVSAELIDIDNKALQDLLDKKIPVIDVRLPEEWQTTGIVKDSYLMTFFDKKGRYDAKKWLTTLEQEIDPATPFVLICHSGGRTSMIGKWLGKQFDTVYHLEDGIAGWMKEKRSTVGPPG